MTVRTAVVPLILLAALLTAAGVACRDGKKNESATATPRPVPSPVKIFDQPQGISLSDPAFDALPGASAEFGNLGGTVYQIEIADNWNGRLVVYMHGFQDLAAEGSASPPPLREYLIAHGYAWAASSFSSTSQIPGRAADETAALWDFFAQKHGRPTFTYVTGESMGGTAAFIAAERYSDRFDGALPLCGAAGQSENVELVEEFLVAGAYAVGVTQPEFDAVDGGTLIRERIIPALRDAAAHRRFEDTVIALTGGPRAFDREGIWLEEQGNWERTAIVLGLRLISNRNRSYELRGVDAAEASALNRAAVRMDADPAAWRAFTKGEEFTGDLQIPVLAIHTTGDEQVPIDQEQIVARKVGRAGKSGLLVQRIVREAEHCGFTAGEMEASFEALVEWVEQGAKPAGDDVLVDDLGTLGARYTLAPRWGSLEADAVPGADERVTLSGSTTIDGDESTSTTLWAEVINDGLTQVCSFRGTNSEGGRYTATIASDAEVDGCGATGATVRLVSFDGGKVAVSPTFPWPSTTQQTYDASLISADPDSTSFFGTVRDRDGRRMPPGTVIDATIDGVTCGHAVISRVIMQFSDPDSYAVVVAGPLPSPKCAQGGAVTFAVNGAPVTATASNVMDGLPHRLDLALAR